MTHVAPTPHDVEAEAALLGSVLCLEDDPVAQVDRLRDARVVIGPIDFYRPEHGALFGLLCDMVDAGQPLALVVVTGRVQRAGPERFGGVPYVVDLANAGRLAAPWRYLAGQIAALSIARTLWTRAAADAQRVALDDNPGPAAVRAALVAQLELAGGLAARALDLTDAEDAEDLTAEHRAAIALLAGGSWADVARLAGREAWREAGLRNWPRPELRVAK